MIRGPGRRSLRGMTTKRLRRTDVAPRISRLADPDGRQLEFPDVLVESLLRRVNEEAEKADRRAAEDLWDQGALLNETAAMMHDPDAVVRRFVDGADAARERMGIAKATTRWLAGVYGLSRLRLGMLLLERVGLASLDQLEAVDLPVKGPDARPVRFPATRAQLVDALGRLRDEAATVSPRPGS